MNECELVRMSVRGCEWVWLGANECEWVNQTSKHEPIKRTLTTWTNANRTNVNVNVKRANKHEANERNANEQKSLLIPWHNVWAHSIKFYKVFDANVIYLICLADHFQQTRWASKSVVEGQNGHRVSADNNKGGSKWWWVSLCEMCIFIHKCHVVEKIWSDFPAPRTMTERRSANYVTLFCLYNEEEVMWNM